MTSPRIENFLARLTEATGQDPRPSGSGWMALCPAHDDRRPSLSICEGDDGRALVHCHAGCSVDAICAAVGLRLADLMADDSPTRSTSTLFAHTRRKRHYCRRDYGRRAARSYHTANAAVAALERQHGKRSAHWTYHDAYGNPVGVIIRWETATGKEIRPVAKLGDHWIIGGMPPLRPLYRRPELNDAKRIYVLEGEKCADLASSIGLVATTSAHGAQSPDKTDWSPLAGRECVILPDRGKSGAQYAHAVLAILEDLSPSPTVKVVELPDLLRDGDDVEQFITARKKTGEADHAG